MKRGTLFNIHGAYKSKSGALRKERRARNRFILKRRIKGRMCYIVVSKKRG
jgi:hypothetical protein